MAIPGYGTAVGVIARIIDTLWPSKKEALFEKLKQLEFQYNWALIHKEDTKAATILKQMKDLRRKAGLTNVE